jgi:hypothetical protein
MELSSLARGGGGRDKGMFWLLGFGASASYTSCRSGQPSLETVLGLHPVVVPDGGLALSLGGDRYATSLILHHHQLCRIACMRHFDHFIYLFIFGYSSFINVCS